MTIRLLGPNPVAKALAASVVSLTCSTRIGMFGSPWARSSARTSASRTGSRSGLVPALTM